MAYIRQIQLKRGRIYFVIQFQGFQTMSPMLTVWNKLHRVTMAAMWQSEVTHLMRVREEDADKITGNETCFAK